MPSEPGGRSGHGSASILPYLLEALRAKVNTGADAPDPPDSRAPPEAPPPAGR